MLRYVHSVTLLALFMLCYVTLLRYVIFCYERVVTLWHTYNILYIFPLLNIFPLTPTYRTLISHMCSCVGTSVRHQTWV